MKYNKHPTASCQTGMPNTATVGRGVTMQSKLGGDMVPCSAAV